MVGDEDSLTRTTLLCPGPLIINPNAPAPRSAMSFDHENILRHAAGPNADTIYDCQKGQRDEARIAARILWPARYQLKKVIAKISATAAIRRLNYE